MEPRPEYIKHMMDPKQEGLREGVQKEWKPQEGDCFATGSLEGFGPILWLVVEVRKWGVFAKGSHLHDMRRLEQFLIPNKACQWLPDLGQWLEMIEAKGKKWSLSSVYDLVGGEGLAYFGGVQDIFVDWEEKPLHYTDGDELPEIAAAQLWGRLEGVG